LEQSHPDLFSVVFITTIAATPDLLTARMSRSIFLFQVLAAASSRMGNDEEFRGGRAAQP
jgi:hypothetical protein